MTEPTDATEKTPQADAPEVADSLRIHSFASLAPGPRLVVLGGVHGDETCGTAGIERVLAEFDSGALAISRGRLTLLPIANPLARRRGQREGERNLNRLFRPTRTPADYEARITNMLCPLLAAHDVLLDLHSFESAGDAFAMIGPRDNRGSLEPFQRAFEEGQLAFHLGTSRVVEGWLDVYADGLAQRGQAATAAALDFGRGTNEFMRSRGGYAVTLECGQHRDPAAPEVAQRAIHAALRLLGMVAGAEANANASADTGTDASADTRADAPPESPSTAPEVLRLRSVIDRAHADDHFVRDWATFDPVAVGETIGMRHDGTPVVAECDGFIVFPNPVAMPGSEWFYLATRSDRQLAAQ